MSSELTMIDPPDIEEIYIEEKEELTESEFAIARKLMWDTFCEDPEFKATYEANVACLLMDNIPGLKRGQNAIDLRNKVAEMIMDRIFS